MKSSQIINLLMVILGAYDLISLPFTTFLITLVIAGLTYAFTKEPILTLTVLFAPQLIRLLNAVVKENKETFVPTNPQEVVQNVQNMKKNKSESFRNPTEISQRITQLKNETKVPKNEEVSGVEDDGIEGTMSAVKFLEQFENLTGLNEIQRIHTVNETAVPAMPTIENKTRSTAAVEAFDNTGVNTALIRSTNSNKPVSSNIESIEIK
uniref:Uncharacterized protein n=1 Tax=viral metagenome TaxID=1070528 RepID=A0A6C0IE20_9ZZZZ